MLKENETIRLCPSPFLYWISGLISDFRFTGRLPKPLWVSSDALRVPPDGQCTPPDAPGTPQYPVRTPPDALGEASDAVRTRSDALGSSSDAVLTGKCPVFGISGASFMDTGGLKAPPSYQPGATPHVTIATNPQAPTARPIRPDAQAVVHGASPPGWLGPSAQ